MSKAEGQKAPALEGNAAFCVLPFVHSYFSPDGHFYLCCVSSTPVTNEAGRPYNIQTDRLLDVFHSKEMELIRQRMLAGEKTPHCQTCYTWEETSPNSHRQMYNNRWLHGEFQDLDLGRRIHELGARAVAERPLSADFRFGNLCNLQCQICNAHNSSKIEADPGHSAWNFAPNHRLPHRFDWTGEWYEAPELVEEINRAGADVLDIKLGGGEPSISKVTMAWLKQLIDTDKASNIRLSISTNTTNASPLFFDLIRQFRAVTLFPSVDGFGPLNEYLRYPSRWEIVDRNARSLKAMRREHARLEVHIAPVVTLYNVLTITDLFDWAVEMGFGVVANEVRGVDQIDLALLPPAGRRLALERLSAFLTRSSENRDNQSIRHVCSVLEKPFDEVSARRDIARFWDFTNYLDERRGMSFSASCPETSALLKDFYATSQSIARGRATRTTLEPAPAAQSLLRRAVAELERDNWDLALALLDAGASAGPVPGMQQARATALARLARPREAADALLQELTHYPSFHAFRFLLAMVASGWERALRLGATSLTHRLLQALDEQAERLEQSREDDVSLLNAANFVIWLLSNREAIESMWLRLETDESRAKLVAMLAARALASGRPLIVTGSGAPGELSLAPSHRDQDSATLETLFSRLGIAYRPGLKRTRARIER